MPSVRLQSSKREDMFCTNREIINASRNLYKNYSVVFYYFRTTPEINDATSFNLAAKPGSVKY